MEKPKTPSQEYRDGEILKQILDHAKPYLLGWGKDWRDVQDQRELDKEYQRLVTRDA